MTTQIINFSKRDNSTQVSEHFDSSTIGREIILPIFPKKTLLNSYSNSTNRRCINAKAGVIAGLGFEFEDEENAESSGVREFLNSLYSKDGTPKPFEVLLKDLWVDYELFGESRLEIRRIAGKVQNLFVLSAKNCYISPDREKIYQYDQLRNRLATFKPYGIMNGVFAETLCLTNFSPEDDFYGVPCFVSALDSMRTSEKICKANLSALDNVVSPSIAMIITGYTVTNEEIETIKNEMDEQRYRTGKPLMLNFGNPDAKVEIQNTGVKQLDGNFLNENISINLEILALHGLTPELFGIISGTGISSGEKATGALKIFNQTVVRPAQAILEKMFTEFLKKEFPTFKTKFLLKQLDLTDTEQDATTELSKAQTYQAYITIGSLELFNNYRETLGYAEITAQEWQSMKDSINGVDYSTLFKPEPTI
jgi:phage portal protein BeeE